MAYTCAVKNCSKGAYWLNKWKKQQCESCGCLHKDAMCKCDPPFRLFAFPTKIRAPVEREKWKQLIGRRNGNKLWSPSKDSRLCCSHFVDGKPTKDNPNPTVNLGYDGAEKRVKRMTLFDATSHKVNAPKKRRLVTKPEPLTAVVIHDDPDMEALPKSELKVPFVLTLLVFMVGLLLKLHEQFVEIQKLKEKISELRGTVNNLKNNVCSEEILQSDKDVTFLTGLNCKSAFYKLHSLVAPFVNRKWRGVLVSKERISKREDDKIGSKCQLLLTLMKLRLGLLNKDLAKRFCISETLCSRIFFTWLRALRTVLECNVYIPDEETLIATNPQRFRKLKNLHTIIDCTELFIETPKDLHLQSASWSDYKHHNTLKFLVACTPNSSIAYVSPAYMGRISDKALTMECGYLNRVPPYTTIMADKGFKITEECAERNIEVYIPPGRRGQSQMSQTKVKKTKNIANLRILIEQVIRRLKTFRILSTEMPIQMINHVDDIIIVCAALCNLKKPIYRT